ncbi:unnamed protein product [Trichogramma brassicae]|uniref:CHK kinase-like domain-containing protein n=1 Tax=Trichogramma brassicae TaxID=86971 RepID=A0A6H5IFF8_9HYME|nr:unnamed protein product [Trichogramma brassicae]
MSDSEETDVSYADWNISRDWLEGVLQEYLGKDSQPEVVEFTIRPGCNSGESVLSDILAIGLEYRRAPQQAAEQINLIVKRLPQDPYIERGLPQLARFLERRPGLEAVLEALLALRPRTKEVIANLLAPEDPLALITHTDFWCNNLLFRANDDGACECAILDWQMVTYSRPTNDVALLVVSSLPTELRRRHTSALLDGYWNSLTGSCSTLGLDVSSQLNYTRSDLDRDYRRSTLLALLLCIGSVDVALGDPMTEQRLIDVLEDLQNEGVLAFKDVVEQPQQQT